MSRILTVCVLFLFSFAPCAKSPDWQNYAVVLQQIKPGIKHGVPVALVDYSALKASSQLNIVYQQIKHFKTEELDSRQEKLAFYINLYNILALKMIADHWPVSSIKDIGHLFSPVWDKPAGIINGRKLSLDDIENNYLRPMQEPRIHLAIVCASVSCPDLRTEPYRAEKLDKQLNDQARAFLHNAKKGLRVDKDEIHVSKIFKWFAKDFEAVGGVEAFIKQYRKDLPNLPIIADIDYDWDVNGLVE